MIAKHSPQSASAPQRNDLLAIGSIFLYCILYTVVRLMISSSMELDEAEQFLNGAAFSWGYSNQPTLYSWIIRGVSLFSGLNLGTIVAVKYSVIFLFYVSFYSIARFVWNAKESFLITCSLLLFPSYAYEFNRDLSHTILAALMAALTCLIYIKLLKEKKTIHYVLIGVSAGLGMLSKYNFAFFMIVLLLASGSFREGRRMLFDKRVMLSFASCCLILLPHLFWLVREDFPSLSYALDQSRAGTLPKYPFAKIISKLAASYTGTLIFFGVFIGFFRRSISRSAAIQSLEVRAFRLLALYGLAIPLIVVAALRTGHFAERWLAPILFILPLALFSMIRWDMESIRFKAFRYLCVSIGVMVLAARAFIGFAPETAGKVERIHIPFKEVSLQLAGEIRRDGFNDLRGVAIVSDSVHLAANLMVWMPGTKFVPFQSVHRSDLRKNVVIVWNASKLGRNIPKEFADRFPAAVPLRPIEAPFIRAKKFPPYILGAAIVPHGQAL